MAPGKYLKYRPIYLQRKRKFTWKKPTQYFFADQARFSSDEYISDPAHPVPYTEDVHFNRTSEYMNDDQRFASRRTDVLTFQTDILNEDLNIGWTCGCRS